MVLLPQRLGHLLYPSLEVRVARVHDNGRGSRVSTDTVIDDVAYELDYLNQADGILIVPNLSTSTVSLDGNTDAGGGAWLVESKTRSDR